MGTKQTTYYTDETLATLNAGLTEGESFSGRIEAIVARYDRIVKECSPELTLGEWCAICDANNGTILHDLPQTVTFMWANVADSEGLGEKWGIDQTKLVAKMRKWSYPLAVACAEIVQRFRCDTSRTDNEDWLRECGAKIIPEKIR